MDQSAPAADGAVPQRGSARGRRRRSRGAAIASMARAATVQPQPSIVRAEHGASPTDYLRAMRPATVWLGLAPALAALALLWGQGLPIEPLPAISVLAAVALALLGANVLDGQHEHEHERAASGTSAPLAGKPEEATASLPARPVGRLLLGLAALAGLPAALAGGAAVFTLGAAGLLAAFFYAATSHPWKRLPGSEVVVAAALGPGVVAATVAGQGHRLLAADMLLGVALGLLALAASEAAHLRDAPLHIASGRRTLVTILGQPRSKLLYGASLLGAFPLALAAAVVGHDAAEGAALTLLALPAGLAALIGELLASTTSARHVAYLATLRAHALFALALLAGIVLVGVLLRVAPGLVP